MTHYLSIVFLFLLALAAPVGLATESWRRFFGAMVRSFFVVVLPLSAFFLSALTVFNLSWKGACHYGWVNCFILGKLAFTPFVLVATASLYRLDVLGEKNNTDRWPVLGIYLGAIVAVTCAAFALFCFRWQAWLLVPLYVAGWYVIRAVQLGQRAHLGFWPYWGATLMTIPSWLLAYEWSTRLYESLPNQPPKGCFVVTAAGQGHPNWVGPFAETAHRGHTVRANRQLITFWRFEDYWLKKSPWSHQLFRLGYNWIGPRIASCIRSPWLADLVFITLKPVELVCRAIDEISTAKTKGKQHYES